MRVGLYRYIGSYIIWDVLIISGVGLCKIVGSKFEMGGLCEEGLF